jgi:signal transduction histidine kinase
LLFNYFLILFSFLSYITVQFTPEGGTVTIRLRKIPPKKHLLEEASIMIETDAAVTHAQKGRTFSSISAIPSYDSKEKERDLESGLIYTDSIPVTRTMTENAADLGTLVLEVVDSGVGMAVEDSKRLFKEVIQFNPSDLQVRVDYQNHSY